MSTMNTSQQPREAASVFRKTKWILLTLHALSVVCFSVLLACTTMLFSLEHLKRSGFLTADVSTSTRIGEPSLTSSPMHHRLTVQNSFGTPYKSLISAEYRGRFLPQAIWSRLEFPELMQQYRLLHQQSRTYKTWHLA